MLLLFAAALVGVFLRVVVFCLGGFCLGQTPCPDARNGSEMHCNQLTADEEQTQMVVWAMMSAPLLMSNDLKNVRLLLLGRPRLPSGLWRTCILLPTDSLMACVVGRSVGWSAVTLPWQVPSASKALLLNKEILQVNQDPMVRMPFRWRVDDGSNLQFWWVSTGVRAFRDSFVDSAQHRFPLFARPLPINGVAFRPNPCTCIESGDATPLSPDTLPLPFLTLFLAFALVRRARGSVVLSPFGLAIVRSIV